LRYVAEAQSAGPGQPEEYIFAGERRGTSLNFHNLENRVIRPALKAGNQNGSGVQWKGFHGLRRGLASNLAALDVNPLLIASLKRHGDVSTTMQQYVKARKKEARKQMEKLQEDIRNRPTGVLIGGK
jgi:integrase